MKRQFDLTNIKELGECLAYYRMLKGSSLKEVSFATGMAISVIHNLEKNKVKSVNTTTLFNLLNYYKLTLKVVA